MTENESDDTAQARTRRHRWFAWVWVVPIAAGAIVLWLGARSFITHGPDVTISFRNAEGLTERQSVIRHRGVAVGRVEALELAPDLSHVIVHARMIRGADAGFEREHAVLHRRSARRRRRDHRAFDHRVGRLYRDGAGTRHPVAGLLRRPRGNAASAFRHAGTFSRADPRRTWDRSRAARPSPITASRSAKWRTTRSGPTGKVSP